MAGYRRTLLLGCLAFACAAVALRAQNAPIRLNTVGFLPELPRQASVAIPCTNFSIVRVNDGQTVFAGKATGPVTNADTSEELFQIDFTPFNKSGAFQLDIPGVGRSAPFQVNDRPFNDAFRVAMEGMYLWRCGTAVSAAHDGQTFAHAACHTNDAYLDFVGGGHVRTNSNGGWHDAGDYNKYVVNAGVTVGVMFRAWDDFGTKIRKVKLGLPATNGRIPEFLAELKWELDWVLTMQAADGSVYHKLSTRKFGGFVMPEVETNERFFSPWSSAATANFVAMLAQAARYFRPYDTAYADHCLQAARRSYEFLRQNPGNKPADLRDFSTGPYQVNDRDARLWAAAELWETTGEADFLRDCEERVRLVRMTVDVNFDYGNIKNLGLLTYLFSERKGRDPAVVATIRSNLLAAADSIVRTAKEHGYARPLGKSYYWGANGAVARQAVMLQAAYRLTRKKEYRNTSFDALSHLLGRNVYGRSFVTGIGYHPPLHPHDRRSGADQVADPWPGYLIGGGHPKATDWHDEEKDYRTNEIAINWNGALIYLLAAFVN